MAVVEKSQVAYKAMGHGNATTRDQSARGCRGRVAGTDRHHGPEQDYRAPEHGW